jgi:CoA:oxalate CoA-transferase
LFKAKDRYLFIFAWLDHHWVKLCEIMGRPEIASDPRFVDNPTRMANQKAVIEIIENWLATLPDDHTAVQTLREARIPSAPVLTLEEAMNHPHLRERQTVQKVHDRILGDMEVPGFPMRFSNFPDRLELDAPFLGEHNERILSGYLGYSKDQIERLAREGVIHSLPR